MKKDKQKDRTAAAAILVAAAIFTMAVIFFLHFSRDEVQLLIMENADTGEIYLEAPLDTDGTFSISYTHSVNKSDVEEYYQWHNQQILLIKGRYHHFGAGVATEIAPGQKLYYDEDGFMIIDQINTPIADLVYKVGTISDHILHIGDNTWHLKELAPSLTSVRFYVRT